MAKQTKAPVAETSEVVVTEAETNTIPEGFVLANREDGEAPVIGWKYQNDGVETWNDVVDDAADYKWMFEQKFVKFIKPAPVAVKATEATKPADSTTDPTKTEDTSGADVNPANPASTEGDQAKNEAAQ